MRGFVVYKERIEAQNPRPSNLWGRGFVIYSAAAAGSRHCRQLLGADSVCNNGYWNAGGGYAFAIGVDFRTDNSIVCTGSERCGEGESIDAVAGLQHIGAIDFIAVHGYGNHGVIAAQGIVGVAPSCGHAILRNANLIAQIGGGMRIAILQAVFQLVGGKLIAQRIGKRLGLRQLLGQIIVRRLQISKQLFIIRLFGIQLLLQRGSFGIVFLDLRIQRGDLGGVIFIIGRQCFNLRLQLRVFGIMLRL